MAEQATCAVLIDALGTLVAMEPPGPRLRAELRERTGLEVSEEQATAAFRAEIEHYLAHHTEGRDPESLARLREACARVLAAALPGGEALDRRAVQEAMLASLRFRAYPDAAPALRELRAREITIVVVSNWDASLPEVLERTGLLPLVDGVVSSASAGAAKPDPRIFEAALREAGVDAGKALFVGDSADRDVAGARAAGIRAVLLSRDESGGGEPGIRTLAELASVI